MAEVTADETCMVEVRSLLEVELSSTTGGLTGDIPSLREQLTEQVKRLRDKDVQKFAKRYETYVGAKTTESLIDSVICLASKALGFLVKIKDPDAFQKELKNDYIINQELSNLAGNAALKCGRPLAVANAALITTKHTDFTKEMLSNTEPAAEQYSPIAEEYSTTPTVAK